MSTEKEPELVGGMPVRQLREALEKANDPQLAIFLRGYAMGFAADQFIAAMTNPEERVGFFMALAGQYPEDWAKALEGLKGERK